MKTLAANYPLAELAWALDVSRSGYYRWLKAPESKRTQAARQLTEHIRRIYFESRQSYGSPRVFHKLRREGVRTSENRWAHCVHQGATIHGGTAHTLFNPGAGRKLRSVVLVRIRGSLYR